MPRESEYVEAPYQGVSQASAPVRLPTQAEAIDNAWAPIPGGASKRPPLAYLGTLEDVESGGLHEVYIRKSFGEFLLVISREGSVTVPRLYDLGDLASGPISLTVTSGAQTYLNSGFVVPQTDLRSVTVEDYTFILNRKVTVANGVAVSPARPFEGMLWVRQAAYARTYKVTVRHGASKSLTTTVTLVTPNGKDATDGKDVDTDVIANGLAQGAYPIGSTSVANGASVTNDLLDLIADGFSVSLAGGVIYLSHPTLDFDLEVEDGQGGNALLAVKDKVQSFSDLPKRGPVDGFTVRLTQQTGTDADDLFIRWEETAGAATGIWQETIAPGANLGVDPATLPVGLIYDSGTSSWSIEVLDWQGRTVGDEELVPDPGFIGQPLKDITFWKERLQLVFAEGGRASSAVNPFILYPTTLASVIASDPFEYGNPLDGQAFFEYAVPFKRALVLWGQKGQAQLTVAGDILTPETAVTVPYSTYEFDPGCRPQASNDRIYFVAPRGTQASAIYEMEVSRTSAQELAEGDDMSVTVPKYIGAGLNKVATSAVNYTTAYGAAGSNVLIVHLYRYSERQRVQNAFQRWTLPAECTLAGMFYVNTRLYVLALRGGVVHVLVGDVADGLADADSGFLVKLDFKVTEAQLTKTYNAGTGETTVEFPYTIEGVPLLVVTAPGGVGGLETLEDGLLDAPEGTLPEILEWDATTVTLEGDWTEAPLIGGEEYSGSIELTRFYSRDAEGKPNRSGRLVIKKIDFDLEDTVALAVRVKAGGRTARVYRFESARLDTPAADYDRVNLYDGVWSVPVGASSEEVRIFIEFDKWAPGSVLGYTWFGEFNAKARRGGA